MREQAWKTYEEVAQHLLHRFAEQFGLGKVEGKQVILGKSGAKWEIDAKGVREGEEGFVVVECRRLLNTRLKQEHIGAIAFRIKDVGAAGGIVVSPMEFQEGAKKIAQHENIVHVLLTPDSTAIDYVMQFLHKVFVGVSDAVSAIEKMSYVCQGPDGNIISQG